MSLHRHVVSCLITILLTGSSATATEFFWAIQEVASSPQRGGGSIQTSGDPVLAMRNGRVWPTIFTQGGGSIAQFSTGWYDITPNNQPLYPPFAPRPLRAASSPTGQVAVAAYGSGFTGPFTSTDGVVLTSSGFTPLPEGTLAIDYTPGGTPVIAIEDDFGDTQVLGLPDLPDFNEIVDVTVSPFGEVAIVTDNAEFYEYSPLLGEWQSLDLFDIGFTNIDQESLAIEYDALGRPHIIGIRNSSPSSRLIAADFNPATGWIVTDVTAAALPANLQLESRYLEFDNTTGETVGTAVTVFNNDTFSDELYYLYFDGDTWASDFVDDEIQATDLVGIAYDFEDLPVIAYVKNGRYHLAYDPILVPEPATALALISLAALTRRRYA
ncbi:MAG: hypothetical protein RLN76_09730 [Phycisphaeraceae bacterium]